METISKKDKINVDFEETVVLRAATDLSLVFFPSKERTVESMAFIVSVSMLLKMYALHAKVDLFMHNMSVDLLQTHRTCEL